MIYKPRDGVVLISVCGAKLLIPDRNASKYCKNGKRLSFLSLLVWTTIKENRDIDYPVSLLMELTHKSSDKCQSLVQKQIEQFLEGGFIVLKDGDHS